MTANSCSSVVCDGVVDLEGLPPAPLVWATAVIDTLCQPLLCHNWRDFLDISPDSPWAVRVPPITSPLPAFLTYQKDFLAERQFSSPWSFNALYEYAFKTPSTALGDLTTPTAAMALILLLLILRAIKGVLLPWFSNLGRKAGRNTHGRDWEAHNQVRIAKFGEYVFRLFYHTCISIYGVYYFCDKEWWQSNGTLSLFRDFPHHAVEPGMAWYYLLQAAYNVDAFLSLIELSCRVTFQSPWKTSSSGPWWHSLRLPLHFAWSKNVRGDFKEMCIHHIITNALVFGSSMCRFTRIGSMVFLVHDVSDVPVDLSKLANFVKYKRTTVACFITMVLVWMATRLYILPFVIYRAVLTQSHYILESGQIPPILYVCYRHSFYIGLALLIALHTAWFVMFLRMGYMLVTKNEVHDYSEHKNGEMQQLGHDMRKKQSKRRAYISIADEKKDD